MYWAGVTSQGINGPIPGEILTSLGACATPTPTTIMTTTTTMITEIGSAATSVVGGLKD